jgi:hypothetical protein
VVIVRGNFRVFCNDRWADTFMTQGDLNQRFAQQRLLPSLIWGR